MRELIRFLHFASLLLLIFSLFFFVIKFQINAKRLGWLWQFHLNEGIVNRRSYAKQGEQAQKNARKIAHKSQRMYTIRILQLNGWYKYIA